MVASLDYVLQPDGTYKWQLVELRDKKPQAAPEEIPAAAPRKYTRKTKETETEI
jgi:hypothetical protein